MDVVSPSTSDQELRLYLAAMPLRVRLDQHVGSFLYGFFLTPLDAMSQPAQLIKDESSAPEEELPAPAVLAGGQKLQHAFEASCSRQEVALPSFIMLHGSFGLRPQLG